MNLGYWVPGASLIAITILASSDGGTLSWAEAAVWIVILVTVAAVALAAHVGYVLSQRGNDAGSD